MEVETVNGALVVAVPRPELQDTFDIKTAPYRPCKHIRDAKDFLQYIRAWSSNDPIKTQLRALETESGKTLVFLTEGTTKSRASIMVAKTGEIISKEHHPMIEPQEQYPRFGVYMDYLAQKPPVQQEPLPKYEGRSCIAALDDNIL